MILTRVCTIRSWTGTSACKRYLCLLPEILKSHVELNGDNINGLELAKTSEDLSTITPYYPKTFNLAALVNSSDFLQNLVHLNVDLSKLEKKPHVVDKILKLNFNDIKNHILFIKDFVNHEKIGSYITKNPLILSELIDDLEVRVHYLQSKQFSNIQIQRIIENNPFWLMYSTQNIDRRLGYYQKKFDLCGDEVRFLAAKQPRLITYNLHHVKTNTFVIKEEMGFQDFETKKLLLDKPKLWMLNQRALLERFNFIHITMKIPHSTLLQYPEILLCRNFRVKQRYLFLQKLGRAQFDPTKPNYVPIMALAEDTDINFCNIYAKCNVADYNIFLKTI